MSRLLLTLRSEFKKIADPSVAVGMRAYMKSSMPCHGVKAVPLRAACKRVFKDLKFKNQKEWMREVAAIWNNARFREERYAAIELTGHKSARAFQDLKAMPLYEKLIVEGAWWDLVDTIATNRVGNILKNDPKSMRKLMLQWSKSSNMWKRRTAILCQVKFRNETDLEFLNKCIQPSIHSKEFFLRKAIGWALRSYAWTNPKAVKRYVRLYENALSPLSRREALKNIGAR